MVKLMSRKILMEMDLPFATVTVAMTRMDTAPKLLPWSIQVHTMSLVMTSMMIAMVRWMRTSEGKTFIVASVPASPLVSRIGWLIQQATREQLTRLEGECCIRRHSLSCEGRDFPEKRAATPNHVKSAPHHPHLAEHFGAPA